MARAESVRWQKLYEDLRESSNMLRKSQEQCTDQLQQLQNQFQVRPQAEIRGNKKKKLLLAITGGQAPFDHIMLLWDFQIIADYEFGQLHYF